MKKLIVVVVAVLFLLGAGYLGTKYRRAQFIKSVAPHVKNASLRVANTMRYESDQASKITYKEFFEKVESDIGEIDKRLLEVQTLSSQSTKEVTDPTVDYLKASQVYSRAILAKYRKSLALSLAVDRTERENAELRSSSGYGVEYAMRSAEKALADMKKAREEYGQSIPELLAAVTKLKEAREPLKAIFEEDVLIQLKQLEVVAKQNSSESDPPKAASKSL